MNDKNISIPGFSLIFAVVLIGFSLKSCISSRDLSIKEWEKRQWQLIKVDKNDEPTWKVHKRELVGTNLMEYKIEGDIKSSPRECISAFKQDIRNQANDLKNKKYPVYEIVDESKDSLLTYVIHKEPFPFKNTEMSVRYYFVHDSESNFEEVRWKETWEESSVPPPSKKLSRVQIFRGSWRFLPILNNQSRAVNIVQFNPKKMPQWLVTPMVTKFLRKGLDYIRETTSK